MSTWTLGREGGRSSNGLARHPLPVPRAPCLLRFGIVIAPVHRVSERTSGRAINLMLLIVDVVNQLGGKPDTISTLVSGGSTETL
jgi:hypothetical protein